MYFSSREEKILELLLDYQSGVPVKELQQLLQVSKRTVYREISSLEKTLASLEIQIKNQRNSGLRLVGDAEMLEKLQQRLQTEEVGVLGTVDRQSAITASLLLADDYLKMEALAYDFLVSVATIQLDLEVIATSLATYGIKLIRKKGAGCKVVGSEKNRRQVVSLLIYHGVNEYDFFSYLHQLSATSFAISNNYFLQLLAPTTLLAAKELILEEMQDYFHEVTDNQLQQIIIILALSIKRVQQGLLVEALSEGESSLRYLEIAEKMAQALARDSQLMLPEAEVHFLSRQLEGINYKIPTNIFLETFDAEMTFKVRRLIQQVATTTGNDFRLDEVLFHDLLTHLDAALKRPHLLEQSLTMPTLEKVIEQYPQLYQEIGQEMAVVFPEKVFSPDELAYILIHFASSLERQPHYRGMSCLVLCSSGIGTAKILESRIRKFLPEITTITIAKISEMNRLDFTGFDFILSTIYLPGFRYPYQMISPLLLEEEIRDIQGKISQLRPHQPTVRRVEPVEAISLDEVYQQLKTANQLLSHFAVKQWQSQDTLEATLAEVVTSLAGTIVTDVDYVHQKLIERYLVAPIGIPDTTIALFHNANQGGKEPYFGIFDLSEGFSILAMDKTGIELKRGLLMLAPAPMSPVEQQLLGKISSSIIENDVNLKIYQEGTQSEVYELLNQLLVREIKEMN